MINKNLLALSAFVFVLLITACSQSEPDIIQEPPVQNNDWSIPSNEVFDGGPGKDGIPSIDDPKFDLAENIDYMQNDDLVLAIKIGNDIRAYTHPVLDWHEIINHEIDDIAFALTYCPLTGTGFGWNRVLDGEETTFGVSGLLYNSNLMPYDRKTNSTWSQLELGCVNGELINTAAQNISFLETDWETWLSFYPKSLVTNTDTGFSRNYGDYPYGDYKTNHDRFLFPVNNEDSRLPSKERVLAVHTDDEVKAYQFEDFPGDFSIIEDGDLIIVGSQEHNIITAFYNTLSNGQKGEFEIVPDFPSVLKDQFNNEYDIFGVARIGENTGNRLDQPLNYISYWFALAAFNPRVKIY